MKLRLTSMTAALAVASLTITLPTPAIAGASADFSGCDGLKKPKRKDDGMRGEATVSAYSRVGRGSSSSILASCNRALSSNKLRAEQTLRRAHLLRARAVAHMQMGNSNAALTDLDAAEAAAAEYRGELFFDRSMGASLDLLRAIVLSDQGKGDEAVALAEMAAERRPYAVQIQQAATLVRDVNAAKDTPREQMWSNLARIDPASRSIAARRGTRDLSFEEQVEAAGDELDDLPPTPDLAALIDRNGVTTIARWMRAYEDRLNLGYAQAALGMNDEARARMAEVEAGLGGEPEDDSPKQEGTQDDVGSDEAVSEEAEPDVQKDEAQSDEAESDAQEDETKKGTSNVANRLVRLMSAGTITTFNKLIEARIAVSEDRLEDAAAGLEGTALKSTPATRDLYAAYEAALAARGATEPKLAELGPEPMRNTSKLAGYAVNLRLRPESQRKVIDYKKSRPNILGAIVGGALSLGTSLLGGVERTAGFRSEPNEDGTVKVEYTGNTTSGPVVQEMTLLRAAELTQEAGKSHFLINDRKDYQRYLTSTQYGMEISRTLTGYKTELTISYLDDGASEDASLNAVTVIDDLGPIYYSEKQSAR